MGIVIVIFAQLVSLQSTSFQHFHELYLVNGCSKDVCLALAATASSLDPFPTPITWAAASAARFSSYKALRPHIRLQKPWPNLLHKASYAFDQGLA